MEAENRADTTESLHQQSKRGDVEYSGEQPANSDANLDKDNMFIEESNEISSPHNQMQPRNENLGATLFRNTQENSNETNSASKTGDDILKQDQRTSPLSMI